MKHITVINKEAEKALKQAWIKAAPKKPEEPDFVSALTDDFVTSMNGLIKSMNGLVKGVLFGGIFIHQSPYVNFKDRTGTPKSCEQGDMLIICHKRVDNLDWYNAALLQWKGSDKPTIKLKSSERKQLELYQNWPTFYIKRKKITKTYDIKPKTVTPGAQYGIFFTSKKTKMYVDMPASILNVNSDFTFGRFVWNMINWETGRPIDPDRTSNDEWSNLIWDLISNSINAHFNRKRIGKAECDRVNGDFFDRFFPKGNKGSRLDAILSDVGGSGGSGDVASDGDDGAISLLLIDIDNDQFLDNYK